MSSPYAHEYLDHELPNENATSWEEALEILKPKYLIPP